MQRTPCSLALAAISVLGMTAAVNAQAPQCADVRVHAECHVDPQTHATTLVLETEAIPPAHLLPTPPQTRLGPPSAPQVRMRLVRRTRNMWVFPTVATGLLLSSAVAWGHAAEVDTSGFHFFDPVRSTRVIASMLTAGAFTFVLATVIRVIRNRRNSGTVLEF